MRFISKALSGVFCFLLVFPMFALAQTSEPEVTEIDFAVEAEDLGFEMPDFLRDIETEEDWNNLTPEQRTEAEQFFASLSPGRSLDDSIAPEGTVQCFDYYTFGSVKVNVQGKLASTVSGVPFTFTGTIDNENHYPIIDGAIYMKVFRRTEDGSTPINGYDVVYQGFVEEGLSLKANSQMPINFTWNIPAALQSGQYQAAFFFTSAKRFNLLGLPFTDDVVGNTVSFTVAGELENSVSFVKDAVTVDGEDYYFAAFTPKVDKLAPIEVVSQLHNTTAADQKVPVTITTYAWDQQRTENIVETKSSEVLVPAGETVPLTYIVTDTTSSVYLVVFEAQYMDTKSVLNVRFTRSDIPSIRINFPSVLSYPLVAGEENTLFSCLHAAGTLDGVNEGKLVLTLKDENNNAFHTYEYNGRVTGDMMGVAEVFTPARDYSQFTLTAALYHGDELIDSVDMEYSCAALGVECPPKDTSVIGVDDSRSAASPFIKFFAMAIIFVALLAIFFKIIFKHSQNEEGHGPDDLGNSNGISSV